MRPHRIRLKVDELESRFAPAVAVLSHIAPPNGVAEVFTVRMNSNGSRLQILNGTNVVASLRTDDTSSVAVTAAAAEGDSLNVNYSFGAFTQRVMFNGGASGAAATVAQAGGAVTLDFSASTQAIFADIGLNSTTVSFAGGGGVTVVGTVTTVIGTGGNDTYVDNTPVALLTIVDAGGDDMYRLVPGSTIDITDGGGMDTLSFATNPEAVVATIGDSVTTVIDPDGTVVFTSSAPAGVVGTVESVIGTALGDTFIDMTTIALLTIVDRAGDDMYRLVPGSTIDITDGGGMDTLSFATNPEAVVATIGDSVTRVTEIAADGTVGDGRVVFTSSAPTGVVGTVESVIGTALGDTFIDMTTIELLTLEGLGGPDTYDLQPGSSINVKETGADADTISLKRANFGVNANLGTGVITDTKGNKVFIITGKVENLVSSPFADTLVGDNGPNTYFLTPGASDVIIDSGGIDTIDFSQTTGTGVNVDLSRTNGSAQNIAPGAKLALNGVIERLIGTNQADVLTGGSGNDFLVGLGGDDRLLGQSGNDLLLGGDGNDELNAGSGNDILVGGRGSDRLNGGSGEDILIAGSTSYDDDRTLTAWSAIHAVWTGTGSVASRVASIRAGVGPMNQFRLKASGMGQTVLDDGNADTLTGGQSSDWFFAFLPPAGNDTITDKDDQEFLNDLP